MATTLYLCGVRIPCLTFSKRESFFQHHQLPLHFGVSDISFVPGEWVLPKGSRRTVSLQFTREAGNVDLINRNDTENQDSEEIGKELTCVMKFGGSSVASADRMREVADLILSFPEERPVIVLSAMGKTTNNLLLVGTYCRSADMF